MKHAERPQGDRYKDTKTLFLIRKTSHKITIVKPNIFYMIHDTQSLMSMCRRNRKGKNNDVINIITNIVFQRR